MRAGSEHSPLPRLVASPDPRLAAGVGVRDSARINVRCAWSQCVRKGDVMRTSCPGYGSSWALELRSCARLGVRMYTKGVAQRALIRYRIQPYVTAYRQGWGSSAGTLLPMLSQLLRLTDYA